MSVIRVKRKERDYFVAKNEVMNNPHLSFKAKGLWAYAMSRPDDWQFNVSHLITVSKEGKKAIYSSIEELIEQGYCYRMQKKNTGGRWTAVDYVICETIEDADKFKKCLPHSHFRHAEKRHAEKEPLLSTKEELITEEEPKEEHPLPPKGEECAAFGQFVRLPKKDHEELVVQHGESLIKTIIEEMNDHLAAHGKKPYKDFSAAIRNWIRRRKESKNGLVEDAQKVNESIMQALKDKFSDREEIDIGYNYVGFKYGPMNYVKIMMNDNGFREQVLNNLRKMNLEL